jgi:hypothetical protein
VKLYVCKGLGATLRPADEVATDAIRKFPAGEIYEVEIKRPRNLKFHRKAFALMQLAYENQENYTEFDKFRRALVIEAGYFDDLRLLDGATVREAKSLSFAKMDEDDFGKLYNALINTILRVVLPGVDRPELEAQVEQFLWA